VLSLKVYHNSHDQSCRSPFGAVEIGTIITLKVRVETKAENLQCLLKLVDHRGQKTVLPMVLEEQKQKENIGQAVFAVSYQTSSNPNLLWYYFQLWVGGQVFYYGNNQTQLGGEGELRQHNPLPFQITVFKPGSTPAWYKEGIMYQIFVDRFNRGKDYCVCLAQNKLGQDPTKKAALLHLNWEDRPDYFKDHAGRVTRWNFFGGNLAGIIEKLDYLETLGVSILYLNPIFLSPSNHKYDTADYFKIDPLFGDRKLFGQLVAETDKRGMALILDGVFSHTGADSIYFNKYNNFKNSGACQSKKSPYYPWYTFSEYPQQYDSWWGIDVLPNVNKAEPSFQKFIYQDPDSVVRYWLKTGIKGWRLDVADELPDSFIKGIKQALREEEPEAVLIGEVWEDASHKISYGKLREYFWGDELDGVMNYPLRKVWLDFLTGQIDGKMAYRLVMSLYENYPKENFYGSMNLIGSHDRRRALTILGEAPPENRLTPEERAQYRLPPEKRQLAVNRMKLLVLLQMTFPGVPSIYYGDEAGSEGYSDPYNRAAYPWGKEDGQLLDWHRRMTYLRREYSAFTGGEFQPVYVNEDIYGYFRTDQKETIGVFINRSSGREHTLDLSQQIQGMQVKKTWALDLLAGEKLSENELSVCKIPPLSARVILLENNLQHKQKTNQLFRGAGILLSITSLPSPWGMGDLGQAAYHFVDFLKAAGQSIWQVLPLQLPDKHNSPYYSSSSFAANEALLDSEQLVSMGFLTKEEVANQLANLEAEASLKQTGFSLAAKYKNELLKQAFHRFRQGGFLEFKLDYKKFKENNKGWLEDYALYRALKKEFNEAPWYRWERGIARRNKESISRYQELLAREVEYHSFLQYLFSLQWGKLKAYANQKGIIIMGDLPIYVAPDSCDTWVNPELFNLTQEGPPYKVGGVPPDYFSREGQLWGNPTYCWKNHEGTGYSWWKSRIKNSLHSLDYLRLDHFRGFVSFWEIPQGAATAASGNWRKGPGKKLFESLCETLGPLPLIAEDLGTLSPEVANLKNQFGFPGMKVLQFSLNEILEDADYEGIYYSGTHDNETLLGWYEDQQEVLKKLPGFRKKVLQDRDQSEGLTVCKRLLEILYYSKANWVIIPLQDLLLLGNEARMNTPGVAAGNWQWTFSWEQIPKDLAPRLQEWVRLSGRE